jgi:adenine phosphoribosyltransferase
VGGVGSARGDPSSRVVVTEEMALVNGKLKQVIRDIPDFPKPGIVFKDVTTLLKDPERFREALEALENRWRNEKVDVVAGIESRGFIFAAPLADRLRSAFVPLRKRGKLPAKTRRVEYALEYGTDTLEMHEDALARGDRVLIVDDLLATGGTAAAAARLIEEAGGEVVGLAFVVRLAFLPGASKLENYPTHFLVEYD